MTLTMAQRDRVVALRLAGRPIREVVAETGHSSATVSKVWHLYLAESAQDRRPELNSRREELLQRLEQNAADARAGAEEARAEGNHGAACRYLSVEASTLRRLSDIELASPPGELGASTSNPLPWKTAEEVIAYRVADLARGQAWRAAELALYPEPFSELIAGKVPEPAELVPEVLEALGAGEASTPNGPHGA
jgi:hypothetical protein